MKTAVALIIFNRPDTTERVFLEIAKVRPPKLLVIADGPRSDRLGERERCNAARAIIDRVDWQCDVLTNYSEVNLGCKNRVSSGIDWVFSQVEEAIILEDDCLPTISFFQFCEEMLDRYRLDERIGMIAGTNFLNNKFEFSDSYYFSRYMSIWGWATWRRAWQNYDREIRYWPKLKQSRFIQSRIVAKDEQKYWIKVLDRVYAGVIDTWDYQWVLHNWTNSRLSIVPNVNLISNIGFRSDATHTANASIYSCLDTQRMAFPLSHPERIYVNASADAYSAKAQFTSLWRRLIRNRFKATLRRVTKGISII